MRNLSLLIGCCLLGIFECCGQYQGDTKLIEKVTRDFSRNSYFVPLRVNVSDSIFQCVIENGRLYYYLYQKEHLSKEQYWEFIKSFIQQDKVLKINAFDLEKIGFIPVRRSAVMENDIKKGKEFIIKKYFNNRIIRDNISDTDRAVLIATLFKWGKVSKVDDESGYLILE
jgi:hypothetical protein